MVESEQSQRSIEWHRTRGARALLALLGMIALRVPATSQDTRGDSSRPFEARLMALVKGYTKQNDAYEEAKHQAKSEEERTAAAALRPDCGSLAKEVEPWTNAG
jgi:hypothetical protein